MDVDGVIVNSKDQRSILYSKSTTISNEKQQQKIPRNNNITIHIHVHVLVDH